MSRPPPLKPMRSTGENRSNISKSSVLQPVHEEECSQEDSCTSGSYTHHEDSQRLTELSPLSWSDFFQVRALVLPESYKGLGFRVYAVGSVAEYLKHSTAFQQTSNKVLNSFSACTQKKQPLLLLFHGGGYSALSFGLLVRYILRKLPNPDSLSILAFDARGHGETELEDEQDLSAERQVEDALSLLKSIYGGLDDNVELPPVVLAGHSMGGAIAIRVGASGKIPTLRGLVVIDVVEGTAMSSLPHMQSVLLKRPKSFSSIEKAILHALESKQTKSKESCRLSLPSQLRFNKNKNCYYWRTSLEESECYWKGWFENLSSLFLQVDVPKLLLLAGQDRLDKTLTIAQMQGRFQLSVVRDSGHNLHEDQPEATAQIFIDFLRRHTIVD